MLYHRLQVSVTAVVVVIVLAGLAITLLVIPSFNQRGYCSVYDQQQQQQCFRPPTSWVYDGILQLYQHKPGGAIYNVEHGERPFNSGSVCVAVQGCGWFTNQGGQTNIRNEVPSDPTHYQRGYLSIGGYGPYNQDAWRQAGYMDTPRDWKNIEISALFYLPPGSGEAEGTFGPPGVDYVLRGGVNENTFPQSCQATNYHIAYNPTGERGGMKLERDLEHTNGYCSPCYTGDTLPGPKYIPLAGTGKVFGYKVVLYNNQANTQVRIDAYVDITGTGYNWVHMWSYIDKGGDPNIDSARGSLQCAGIHPELPISWAGPLSGLRENWAGGFFRQLTIDEIIVPRF